MQINTIIDLNYDVKAYTYAMICNRKHEYLIACLNVRSLVIWCLSCFTDAEYSMRLLNNATALYALAKQYPGTYDQAIPDAAIFYS